MAISLSLSKKIKTARRSPAKELKLLPKAGRFPLYRIGTPANFRDLLVGATLGGRYWVLSVLGRGGMSVVYKAKEKYKGQIVAVKTLRTAGLTDEMLVKRFQREAELLSLLNHPRIVNIHAYGTSSKGQPYFVMDYLVGENLTDILRREDHLSSERFQDIFVQVCAAIEHAHKHGAIHRDIKPGNIMLTCQGNTSDYVKVVDFGIAKMAEEAQKLTRMGEVWGSPIYMSPEQCMGSTIDARSDIYSLGVVMYESLTGRVPFLGKNYADTMTKQISELPPPFREIRPELNIPEAFENIVLRAIAKRPEDRYQSMTTMRKDLEAALSFGSNKRESRSSYPNLAASENEHWPKTQKQSYPSLNKIAHLVQEKLQDNNQDAANKTAGQEKKTGAPAKVKTTSVRDLPKRSSKKRHRNPQKIQRLLLVSGCSLLLSFLAIATITNGQEFATFLAEVARALVKGLEEEQTLPN
jgi:serine/threonine-protein kinase